MTAPFRFAGKGRSPPGSTGKVGPCGFREKSSSPVLRYFPRKTLPVEAVCTTAPKTGNGIPIKHEDYESERKNQENSRQQVGKDGSIGPRSRHSWLYSHGISPVWTAVAIVCFRGLFRFLYRIACILVALAIILCILSFLVF